MTKLVDDVFLTFWTREHYPPPPPNFYMQHIPVLKNETLDCFSYLSESSDGFFVDGTIGAGGHSIAIAKRYKKQDITASGGIPSRHGTITKFIGIDKDKDAIKLAKRNIEKSGLYDSFILIHDDFTSIIDILLEKKINSINGALLDLGVSSMQFDQKNRGFSFTDMNSKLDMRMDQSQKLDAIQILNHYPEEKIEKILREYGEEKFSRSIAKNICLTRRNKQIKTVGDLIYILEKSIPLKIQKTSRSHFATKTFQAIRIEVNNELDHLEKALRNFVELLIPGGRLAVITFHSLEDRIVKNTFRDLASNCSCPENAPICNCDKIAQAKLINKKPIVASDEEVANNPRSRSAKLRIIEKI